MAPLDPDRVGRRAQGHASPDPANTDRDVGEEAAARETRLRVRGAVEIGPFGIGHKIRRALWYFVHGTIYQLPVRRLDCWRVTLLRLFGANIGQGCMIRRTARIEIPWHLHLGDRVVIGDRVILYSLGRIVIDSDTLVSQGAHLCAGDHDVDRWDSPLRRVPISIGRRCWIAADAFVGPGVDVGDGTILGARSAAFRDLPQWTVCVGTPAKPHRTRYLPRRASEADS